MIDSLIGLSHDDIGGLTDGKPWLLATGGESWQAIFERLRDDCPRGVILGGDLTLVASFLQAWARASHPHLVIVMLKPHLLNSLLLGARRDGAS